MLTESRFLTIGHRGCAGEHFENSLDGFKHALSLGIDAVELDIRLQAGDLWVIHDHQLERLTTSQGLFSDLQNPETVFLKNRAPIPRLREVLDLLWGKIPMNIEIKSFHTATALVDLLSKYPPLPNISDFPWILISSFDHRQILQLRRQNCPWALAPVTYGLPMQPDDLIHQIQPYSWHMDHEYLDYALIHEIQAQGVRVMVYTVNDTESARQLKRAGMNGIFTDFPSHLRDLG